MIDIVIVVSSLRSMKKASLVLVRFFTRILLFDSGDFTVVY